MFGELTEEQVHDFGHVQEELAALNALGALINHRIDHILADAASRLGIPDGVVVRIHVDNTEDHVHAYVVEAEV